MPTEREQPNKLRLDRLRQEGFLDGRVGIIYRDPSWGDAERSAYDKGQADACRERGEDGTDSDV